MTTILICTDIIQSHLLLSTSGLRLKEHRLPMSTLRASMILCPRQGRIRDYVRYNVRQLINFVHNFVHVNAIRVGFLFVVTISASVAVKKDL